MAWVEKMPRPFDKIFVFFQVEDDRHEWWPATVLRTKEFDNVSTIVGTATLQFAAFQGFKETTEEVVFLQNRIVRCEDGETPWRSSAEAADAGEGNVDEASWEHEKTRQSPRKKRKGAPTRRFPMEQAMAIADAMDNRTQNESSTVDSLLLRVAGLENSMSNPCDHAEVIKAMVDERTAILKTRVIEALSRSTRQNGSKKCSPFHGILQTASFKVSELAAYNTFRMLTEDISTWAIVDGEDSIEFLPSLSGIINPARAVHTATVVFKKASALLGWLGVEATSDVRALVVRDQSNGPTEMIRVAGGMLRRGMNHDDLRLFVGRGLMTDENEALAGVPALRFDGGRWDSSNGLFATPPTMENEYTVLTTASDRCLEGCFKMSWTWKNVEGGRMLTSGSRWSGGVRLGVLQIELPFTTIVGRATCTRVRALLSQKWLNENL